MVAAQRALEEPEEERAVLPMTGERGRRAGGWQAWGLRRSSRARSDGREWLVYEQRV